MIIQTRSLGSAGTRRLRIVAVAAAVVLAALVAVGMPETNHPIEYAKAVAAALFTWETKSGLMPRDYGTVVLDDADPSGVETNGLASDLANYLCASCTS